MTAVLTRRSKNKEAGRETKRTLVHMLDDAVVIRASTLARIVRVVNSALGQATSEFWYELGKEAGEEMASILITKMKSKRAKIARFLFNESQSTGWGKITFHRRRLAGIEGAFRVEDAPLLQSNGTAGTCQFYRGYAIGFLSRAYDIDDIRCVESSCVSKGSPFCEFKVERPRMNLLRCIFM